MAQKPPRPTVRVAGWLMIAGAAAMAIGTGMPWLSVGDRTYNGFEKWTVFPYQNNAPLGPGVVVLAIVLIGLGGATVAAGRLLPVVIIGIVVAAWSLFGSINQVSNHQEVADHTNATMGAGLGIVLLGAALSLAGAITGCAKRRRWPAPSPAPADDAVSPRR